MEGKREDWGGEGRRGMVFASVKINSWYGPGLCMKAPIEEIYDKSTQVTLKSTRCLPDSPKPDSPKLGFRVLIRVRVRVSVSANRVSANRD